MQFYGTYGVKVERKPGVRTQPQLPGGQLIPLEQTPEGTACRYPGVVYWPDVDPCNRPTSALFQNDADWKKYQQTGYLAIKGGNYKPEEITDKDAASLTTETEETPWTTYALYAGLALGGFAALYAGYRFFTKRKD